MKKIIIAIGILIAFTLLCSLAVIHIKHEFPIQKEKVAVIYVQGPLVTENLPRYASSEKICEELRNAEKDGSVKAIVLRINSPGGTPAAAQEIVDEMKKIDKPIVVSMGDMATSGAYYISVPAEKIVANPDTLTGSIGVIWVFENREGKYKEEGINYTIVKSGKMKDMGAPWRNLTKEELEYAYEIVNETYQRFVMEVVENRKLSISEVENLSDGRILLGEDAKELGLIDELGNLYDAIDIAGKLGGISGTPEIEHVNKPDIFGFIFGEKSYMEREGLYV
ncbi:MAG: signal peptide peptidase SppA [Candidatus Syntropharchaeia archaeon]